MQVDSRDSMKTLNSDGEEVSLEHPDAFAMPQVFTFGSIMSGGWLTYFHEHHDEAMKHRRENGLAMYRDLYLQSLIRERANGTMRLAWNIESDSKDDSTEKATCDAMTKIARGIPYQRRLRHMLLKGSLWYGRYAVQVRWGWTEMNLPTPEYSGPPESGIKPTVNLRKKRVLTITDMRPVNGDKIGFRWDGTPYILAGAALAFAQRYNFRMIWTTSGPGILLDDPRIRRQFIIGSYDPDDADYFEPEMAGGVFGVGIRSRIYWFDWMRREYYSWVADSFERIGLGLIVIYHEAGNKEAKENAIKIAKTYSRRSAIVMPRTADRINDGGMVQVVEAPISGAQIVLELIKDIEAKQERFIVGQSMSGGADAGDGLGGSGRAMFAGDTKQDLIAADAEDFGETLTGQDLDKHPGLVNILGRWSYPDLWGKFPMRWRHAIDDGMMSAMKMQSAGAYLQMGGTLPDDEVRSLTGIRAPEDGEKTIGGQAMQPGAGGAPGGAGGAPGAGEPDLNALLHGMGGGGSDGGEANGKKAMVSVPAGVPRNGAPRLPKAG